MILTPIHPQGAAFNEAARRIAGKVHHAYFAQQILPVMPFMQIKGVIHAADPDKIRVREVRFDLFNTVVGDAGAQILFNVGDQNFRMIDQIACQLQTFGQGQGGMRFNRVLRCYQPPYKIELQPLDGRQTDMHMALMRRIERAAQKAYAHAVPAGAAQHMRRRQGRKKVRNIWCVTHACAMKEEGSRLRAGLATAMYNVLVSAELLKAHGSAGVHFTGGNADLGAHSEFTAIGKLR